MNYYDLLGIARDADGGEIKRAYFSAVKKHSPDADPEGFKAIRIAYETLSDQKKRGKYDAYFVTGDGGEIAADMQNDLLAAHALMRENKYKQAAEFMAALSKENPDSVEAKRLLADALWRIKKSGGAEKLCVELLEKNPSDCDTWLLRGKIAASRGHVSKADDYFNTAVGIEPLKAEAWIEYLHFALREYQWLIRDIMKRAMEKDPDMFREEYFLYLLAAQELLLYYDNNDLQYYDKFADFFANDKAHDKKTYVQVMEIMPHITKEKTLIPFAKKILPTLENSRHRTDGDEKNFQYIHASFVLHELHLDKRIHDVLVDLTGFFLYEDDDEKERLSMECYIVSHLPDLRPAIKALKNDYPECFKLNQAFYLDVLNEKKTEILEDKYYAIYKKKLRPTTKGYTEEENNDNDLNTIGNAVPFVRESPKVGRNVLCPCGSGKKYKKCCGKG